jgi:hypothetical protein
MLFVKKGEIDFLRRNLFSQSLADRVHRINTNPETGPERLQWKPKSFPYQNRTRCDHASNPGTSDLPLD